MVAPEGRFVVVGAAVGAVVVTYAVGMVWSTPFWVLFVALLMVFREPKRIVPALPLAIISPVDGKVVAIFFTWRTALHYSLPAQKQVKWGGRCPRQWLDNFYIVITLRHRVPAMLHKDPAVGSRGGRKQ